MDLANFKFSFATFADVDEIKRVFDAHRVEFTFLPRAVFVESIRTKSLITARETATGKLVGFIHFRRRKDKCTKVYQVCVLPECRRQGIGSTLLRSLEEDCVGTGQISIHLACPEELPANSFYAAIGFQSGAIAEGKRRNLKLWSHEVSSKVIKEITHGHGS